MAKHTDKEIRVLSAIATHHYSISGGCPECASDTNTFYYACDFALCSGLTEHQVKGVVTNLVKKGLVIVSIEEDEDNGIMLTELGFSVYINH